MAHILSVMAPVNVCLPGAAASAANARRLTIRGQEVTNQDWRGILAVLTSLGYFLVVSLATIRFEFLQVLAAIGLLSTPEMLVLSWYFKAKEEAK